MICVIVHSVAGDLLDLEVKRPSKTIDLKKRIDASWQIPPALQHLIVGTKIIGDSEQLRSYCQDSTAKLSVTMVVSLERAIQDVRNSTSQEKQITALKPLAQLALKGDESGITTMIACLEEQHVLVRCAAVHVLSRVVSKSDERAITAVSARLEDAEACVRCVAIYALISVMKNGDEHAITLITARIKDPSACVRRAVVHALSTVAEKGNERGITAVLALLEHPDACVRCVASAALSREEQVSGKRASHHRPRMKGQKSRTMGQGFGTWVRKTFLAN